jgi:hypothetical protein
MSGLAKRRQRILRLRGIEHRLAKLRLTGVDAKLRELEAVSDRIAALQLGNASPTGLMRGAALNASSELALRLDRAAQDIIAPTANAREQREDAEAARIAAWQSEEQSARLHARAAAAEAKAAEQRFIASLPWKKRP